MTNSLVYLDSNVLVYAFCEQPDTEKKQQKSIEILANLIEYNNLCVSNLTICEYSYILKRLKESDEKIIKSIEILKMFIKQSDSMLSTRLNEILLTQKLFTNSFDCYHLAFAENVCCTKLITFEKDFNKLKHLAKIEIVIINTDD